MDQEARGGTLIIGGGFAGSYVARRHSQSWLASSAMRCATTRLGDYAAELLLRRGIDIRVSTTLEEVGPHTARLSDGTRLLTSTVVWTAGVKANPFLAELGGR